jgi:hypothetical protein
MAVRFGPYLTPARRTCRREGQQEMETDGVAKVAAPRKVKLSKVCSPASLLEAAEVC